MGEGEEGREKGQADGRGVEGGRVETERERMFWCNFKGINFFHDGSTIIPSDWE